MLKRAKKRYLAIKVEMKTFPHKRDVMNAVWSSLLGLFGEYGASQVGLVLIDYSTETGHLVLRCSNTAMSLLRVALVSVTQIEREKVYLRVISISGTLRALRKKIEYYEKNSGNLEEDL